ncbi:hypothetical protein [Synechococcus sp. MVIR-18-1]|uniref:hypothetical protein n=1 Tax=Synechococcus sp. MVIR-18-1 TaxID=1386941 RepID=UPI001646A4EB|nr:hypothetical protein [Synechococcus sp. MVIR-18-1]QNI75090.1 hypothetical protein SynMVIR181_00075 [Synechococcus sp. MVIR-18-1]
MDADFQEQYVAAEQAYSASEFDKADDLARPLLEQLEPLPASGAERDATLAWRAFVALLLGHIHLYGKDDASQSAEFYRLVLASEPPDTLRELAQQGLSEALERSPVIDVAVSAPAAEELASIPFGKVTSVPASSDLIRDPFLNATSTRTAKAKRTAADNPATETIETAMPWLKAEMDQPKVSQQELGLEQQVGLEQPRELNSSQEKAEHPVNLDHAPEQASTPSLARTFDTDPKRLEAGLLRVNLKHLSQLGSPSAQAADGDQPTSRSLQNRLALAWRSLRRR